MKNLVVISRRPLAGGMHKHMAYSRDEQLVANTQRWTIVNDHFLALDDAITFIP
ncbi:MAG TPA: hypothetical protein K8V32_07025 [Enteractinococcus helveticum]|uniref:Uncharacterized protein n=1 Tax=Enteractinococcus helveticum TaxID=1837282 RepID=A0A921FMH4_9MICC|nr:hypothetical protein [Enteractinococcus helveticum]HJF14545.1 hypothetical protein [Enteractinococcus helveticum]